MTLPGYRLEALVGRGATGTVHRACRLSGSGPPVAVKRLAAPGRPDLVERLRREAEVLASLDHPHVVRILDVVPDGAGVAIVMQYASGGSLADLLAVRGRLSAEEAVAVALPVAEALASAHRRGVLHCDVKPGNILLTADGEPLLSDFGLSRWLGPAPSEASRPGGTPGYLDPCVASGADPDPSSDVYGLGAVCYEMLTGRRPGPRPVPILEAVPDTPASLAAGVERALARRRQDRPANAGTMAATLRAAVPCPVVPRPPERGSRPSSADPGPDSTRSFGPRPPVAPPLPCWPAGPRPSGRLAVAALVLVAVVGAVAVLRPQRSSVAEAAPEVRCPEVRSPLQGDVDGDGCAEPASWSGGVLEVGHRRYRVGGAGDHVLLGDWDCDGRDSPALYRPPSGELLLFHGWADRAAPLEAAAARRLAPNGSPRVRTDPRGCDHVVVG